MAIRLGTCLILLLLMNVTESGLSFPKCDSVCPTPSDYPDRDLGSVPQSLPASVDGLCLDDHAIVSLKQSDFSKYTNIIFICLRRNSITNITIGTFPNLTERWRLDLTSNQINSIQAGSFSNLPQLKALILAFNQITSIQPGSFSNLPRLVRLDLPHNQLTCIQPGVFSDLPKLLTLDLSNNQICNIQPGSFSNLPRLSRLDLTSNQISCLQPGLFTNLPGLRWLLLSMNQIDNIQSGTFVNLPQLECLGLNSNHISNIQNGIFLNLPKLNTLLLDKNQIKVLPYNFLMLITTVNLKNNPWQCDCRMVPIRQKMIWAVASQIRCREPSRFWGQKLTDINPEDLLCEEARIVRFEVVGGNSTLVKEETLVLVCEASGIPTPDITVTLPSGQNVTVESGGRVTVDVNGTIAITNVTAAADAGLYICIAANPVGSTTAKQVVDVQMLTSAHTSTSVLV
ncbi:leucine-rich repeat-containing protein 15-like [Branchiostoma floridae]|uniref:Leucine-rich repeat-containing protein 15-like n=1 Tax=Branchiostoma floridae TaxID=7739 RepID=A0A9J7MQU9_BRAFL|nr:leucine-rich repeat-containing protein 15-like [Branchiostoma floridae]